MRRDLAIIGIGQTVYEPHNAKQNREEMIFEAVSKALSDACITRDAVDSVVLAAHDQADGVAICSSSAAGAAGAHLKEETRVSDDGAFAACLACMGVMAGYSDVTLVVGWNKRTTSWSTITNLSFEPFYHRPFALNFITAQALQVNRFMDKYGVTHEQAAGIIIKNRLNGKNNPLVQMSSSVTDKDIMASRVISWPLKEIDLPSEADGACAIVIAAKDRVNEKHHAAWIKGIGWATDTYYLGNRDLAELTSLKNAAESAYRMADIYNPIKQVDVAEIYDATSYHELMAYIALGFCEHGKFGPFLKETKTKKKLTAMNPSGGVLCANPHAATGLVRIAEAALQVTGRAEGHQVENVNTALAHGMSGICGQSNCVMVLEKNT